MTDRTEALDIEADIRTIAATLKAHDPANGVFENSPAAIALDRLIQVLKASNEAVERVRALVKDHRSRVASPYIHVARLEAALSHPISPERSDEGTEK